MFKCTTCQKIIRKVEDVRGCSRCQDRGVASTIPPSHQDSDWLTPALIGYMIGNSMSGSHYSPVAEETPAFTGGGGDTSGSGSGSSWSDDRSSDSSSSSSSDSSSSSSDSGSSSSDSGSSGGGSSD